MCNYDVHGVDNLSIVTEIDMAMSKGGESRVRYTRNRERRPTERVVFLMTKSELAELDSWGVPAGMPSRAAAIRALIQKGLSAARREAGPDGDGAQAS